MQVFITCFTTTATKIKQQNKPFKTKKGLELPFEVPNLLLIREMCTPKEWLGLFEN